MKKHFAVIPVAYLLVCLVVNSGYSQTSSTSSSTSPTTKQKKKKTSPTPTPQVTPQATAAPSPVAKAVATPTNAVTTIPVAAAPGLFSADSWLYDRVGVPSELQKAVAVAAKTQGSTLLKREKSIFLWLGKVGSGSDNERENSYIRFSLDGIAYGGPRKPWIVLTGTVYEQSGSELKIGNPIEVAVDFRDIRVDYEGTKLGEVNKGNDIADQVYDILSTHSPYQWVLMAQEQVKDSVVTPAFVVKAKEGYSFLQTLETSSRSSVR